MGLEIDRHATQILHRIHYYLSLILSCGTI
jgi:hypothetical protein